MKPGMPRKRDIIVVTHTITMIVKPDPDAPLEDQLHELRSNCEAASDYAFGNGLFTQNMNCEILSFTESTTTLDTSKA